MLSRGRSLLITVSKPRVTVLMRDVRRKKLENHFMVSDNILYEEKTWEKYAGCVGKIDNLMSNNSRKIQVFQYL